MVRPERVQLLPWPQGHPANDPFEDVDDDRTMVFVPALMSVGMVMSAVAVIRDSFQGTRRSAQNRRSAIEAAIVVNDLLGEADPGPRHLGFLSRPSYLVSAVILLSASVFVTIGSVTNFLSEDGFVSNIGWLLALSLALSLLLGFFGGVSLTMFLRWPHPPAWIFGSLRTAPLTVTPGADAEGPTRALSVWLMVSALTTLLVSVMVGSGSSAARNIDEPIARWLVDTDSLGSFAALDLAGSTWVSASFAALVALSAFRCRVMAVLFPTSFVATWVGAELLRNFINRPRPLVPADLDSFPSGHLVQLVFLAGLVPVALTVLGVHRRIVAAVMSALVVAVVLSALYRVHQQSHWPLDVVAGMTFGLTAVLATRWILAHHHWHQRCARCPWSDHDQQRPWAQGLVRFPMSAARWLRRAGVGLALAAAAGLGVLALLTGVPQDPEGYGFATAIARPAQLGLAVLMAFAGVLAVRFRGLAAFLMALAATGLGLFASIQYPPRFAVIVTVALLVPAVLTWLAWQHQASMGSIAVLALMTTAAVAGTASGSSMIYSHYFGPTHPSSRAKALSSDARWLWLGAVGPRTATVVAAGLHPQSQVALDFRSVEPGGSGRVQVSVDEYGLARFTLTGLEPATRYAYAVIKVPKANTVLGDAFVNSADATFTTFADGPQNLLVVLGSCARTGSNGAVFDAMLAENPDLYLALGDLHYANLSSADPSDHIRKYGSAVGQPGQSALVRSIPTAYVWDDHDYGSNDSGADSPSRDGVGTAYRRAVPHYAVNPDPGSPIAQAFTVGRVRFVLTDNRSQRTRDTMLGTQQETWLINELTTSAKSHALVVWANPTPWISAAGSDDWSNYPAERRRISNALMAARVDNLIMVSGDAHMVAIDDGTNSGYATGGGAGFPVLQAAALDRPGHIKGGPYSEGAFPGAGQYGVLQVSDDGGNLITVRLSGRTWDRKELVALELSFHAKR
jgi:PhoD-like phosphatase